MYDLFKDIDESLLRLVPQRGTLRYRLLNTYLSSGLIYNELNYYCVLSDIHFDMTGDEQAYRESESIIARILGVWYLRILANIGEAQFTAFLRLHPKLTEEGDILKLGTEFYYSTHLLIKPRTTLVSYIKSAIQGRYFTKNNRFVINNDPLFKPFYVNDHMVVTNIINTAVCARNTSILNDILLFVRSQNQKVELPGKLTWLLGEFKRVEGVKGNRQHYIYNYFSQEMATQLYKRDPSITKPINTNPKLQLIKG